MKSSWPTRLLVCCALILMVFSAGCRRVKEKPLSPEEVNLQKFGRLYREYRSNGGRAQAQPDEIKEWAKKQRKETLDKLEIDDLDKVFVSPRDNEPYVLVSLPMGMGPMLAHEKTGVGGKRLVLTSQGNVYEADEKRFEELKNSVPGKRGP